MTGNTALLKMRLGHIGKAIGHSSINIVNNIWAKLVAMIAHPGAMRCNKIDSAQYLKAVMSVGKVRIGVNRYRKMVTEQCCTGAEYIPVRSR